MNDTLESFVSLDETVALTGWSRLSLYRRIVEGEIQVQGISLVIVPQETSGIFVSLDEAWAMTGGARCLLYRRIVEKCWPIQRILQPDHPPIIRIALQALPLGRCALVAAIFDWEYPDFEAKGTPIDMAHVSALVHQEARRRLAILGERATLFPHRGRGEAPDPIIWAATLNAFSCRYAVTLRMLGEWHREERYLMAICAGRWIDE